ncbi:MAG: hypothetical protein GY697_27965, partial [Desulfobacterales bacterium]|nr:hypothetical protein [Desulfobacterales bacterium]
SDFIKVSNCEQHLGIVLANDTSAEDLYIEKRIHQCKSIMYGIKALGSSTVPITPPVSTKLYNSVCIPKMLYGCEIMDISQKSLDKLEHFHVNSAKNLQGLPEPASNCGSLTTIGWQSLNSIIDKMQMLFLWRILMLPMSNIYKVLMLNIILNFVYSKNIRARSPTIMILDKCKKYNLLNIVIKCIDAGDYLSISEWKKLVIRNVNIYDTKTIKVTCHLNKSLLHLNNNFKYMHISPWWHYCYKNLHDTKSVRKIIQLVLGLFRNQNEICNLCVQTRFSLSHLLFECIEVNDKRKVLWEELCTVCPKPFIEDINKMYNKEKCTFMLNGFNSVYTDEWNKIYSKCLRFITKMVSEY